MLSARDTVWSGTSPVDPAVQPFGLYLVQILVVLGIARLLAVALARIRQPRVIAEVIGGILLGPSAMGHIPGFTETLFPKESLPALSATANLGLCFYLFLVGLELDPAVLRRNAGRAIGTSVAGMVIPFALGAASSWGLYKQFMDVPGAAKVPPFGSFLLFLGVAMSITAFPVLARILTERKLYPTTVGIATISAAAVDDAAAWCLLALVVSIVNSTSPLVALYTFLCAVGWALLVLFGLRPLLKRVVKWSATRHASNVSESLVFTMFALVMLSSFVTEMIGVHAIFGAFLIGLATPHEDGFALRLTSKIEDMITMIFIPIYFTLSGLKTNIGLLSTGTAWGFVVMVVAVACAGKIIGCGVAARLGGLEWREAWGVGVLMNTKGLVELIVLNVGLGAGVINTEVFTIMVMMALVTTFMTTPLISIIYPPQYYKYAEGVDLSRLGIHTDPPESDSTAVDLPVRSKSFDARSIRELAIPGAPSSTNLSVLVCLKEPGSLPGVMALSALLSRSGNPTVFAIRLSEMDDRLSSVSVAGNFTSPAATMGGDVVLSIFRAFATLNGFQAEPALGFAENGDWSGEIVSRAMQSKVGLVVLPWDLQGAMMDGIEGLPMGNSGIEISATPASQVGVASTGRFDYFFDPGRKGSFSGQVTPAAGLPAPAGAGTTNPAAAAARRNKAIVDSVLRLAYERCPVAVLIDRGFGVALGSSNVISASEEHLDVPLDPDPTMDAAAPGSASTAASTKHKVRRAVVLAFFGGQDDREAAAVALRLSADLTTVVSVLRIKTGPKSVGGKVGKRTDSEAGNGEAVKVAETEPTTEEQVEPAVAGQSADPKPSPVSEDDAAIALLAGRANVSIEEISGAATAVSRVSQLGGRDLVVLGRNAPGISNLLPVSRPLSTSSIASRSLSWLKRPVDTPGLGAGAGAGAGAALTGTSLSVLGELSDRLLAGSTQISADVCIKASVLVVQSRYPALTGSVA